MSKSIGNFFTIDDVLERGFDPRALRLLFLTSHYRSELNFTWENLAGTQKAWDRLVSQVSMWRESSEKSDQGDGKNSQNQEQAASYRERFWTHMEHDLATSEAISVLWEVSKSELSKREKYSLVLEFDEVLGLGLASAKAWAESTPELGVGNLPEEVQHLLSKRQAARAAKDFARSDELRDQLSGHGYIVSDTPVGQELTKVQPTS